MKAKLLKQLRNKGRSMVNIHSVTTCDGVITGMRYGYNDPAYKGLFSFGDSEHTVKEKAARIYINSYLNNHPMTNHQPVREAKKRGGDNGKRKPVIDEYGHKWCNCTTPKLISPINKGLAYCTKCKSDWYH